MAVEFLSQEWAGEVEQALNSHQPFGEAIEGLDLSLQFVVTDVPGRDEVRYYVRLAGGRAEVEPGTLSEPDVTITNSYETAAAISKGELNTQTAFITGRLKVQGNLAKLMLHQAALQHFANAVADIEVEY